MARARAQTGTRARARARPVSLRAILCLLASLGWLAGAGCSSEIPQATAPIPVPPTAATGPLVLPPALTVASDLAVPQEDLPPMVRVGAVMSATGWLSAVDGAPLAAIQTQVEIVNQTGGIAGVPLHLEIFDTASNLNEAFQGGQRMVRDQAATVFVSCDQEFALPAVQETLNHMVTIIPCPVSQWWQRDNVFTFGLSAEAEGRAMAAEVQTKQARTAVVFSDRDSGYSQGVCSEFVRSFEAGGGAVRDLVPISYAGDPDQFSALVQRSALGRVDVVAICSVLPTGRNLYHAIRAQNILTPVVANSLMDGGWLDTDREPGAIDVLSYGSVWGDDPTEAVNQLVQQIRLSHPDLALNGNAIAAADALMAFVAAARQVAARTPDFAETARLDTVQLRQAMRSLENESLVSGFVSLNAGSNILSARQLRVLQASLDVPPRVIALVQAS